ncbi:MAG: 2,3-cyclic 3-phosphodiesterase [Candidatus Cloacimonadota bacterium]|nr:2,3-cyclic 3-phosphodiesterase [Candidatus Cloacimonadota bacterium]
MRVFVALEPPDTLHKELQGALKYFQSLRHKGITWVHPENLHLTVNFIGEVKEHRLENLKHVIGAQAARHRAVGLRAEGFELFPHQQPRLLWLKLSGAQEELSLLNRQLLSSMRELKIDADPKKLKLHVTLGRIKTPQSPEFEREVLAYQIHKQVLSWETLTLYRSILRPEGPRYEIIEQYNLSQTEE